MAKFCKKCGTMIDIPSGKCPNCDKIIATKKVQETKKEPRIISEQPQKLSKKELKAAKKTLNKRAKKDQKKQNHAQLTTKQKVKRFFVKFIAVVLTLILVVSGCTCALVYFDICDVPIIVQLFNIVGIKNNNLEEEQQSVTPPDADEYFSDNSTIESKIDAKKSSNTLTESDTYNTLKNRGFTQYPITTNYSIDGEYSFSTTISDTSNLKHPMYQTQYITASDEIWTVFVIDGDIVANPVSYNMQSTIGVKVVISESNRITSYDSTTNQFYKTIPNRASLIVIVVDKINDDTLEKLTIEEIDKYV